MENESNKKKTTKYIDTISKKWYKIINNIYYIKYFLHNSEKLRSNTYEKRK